MSAQTMPLFTAGEHLLSVQQFDTTSLENFYALTDAVRPIGERSATSDVLHGALLASLFFEPSTRTRLSFEAAFSRLGGSVISTTGFSFSSMAKGESIADTARVVSGYANALVVRHPDEGSVAEFAASSLVPVINAGDGTGEHPSQALLDVYTISRELRARGKNLSGSTVAIIGDLKYGRTVHSLMKLAALVPHVTFHIYAPPSLEIPQQVVDYSLAAGNAVHIFDSVVEAIAGCDVIYTTRVQRERITEEVIRGANLSGDLLNAAILQEAEVTDAIICHPLPRDSRPDAFDLSADVDNLPGLSIFHQTDNGLLVRMAIFLTTLGISRDELEESLRPTRWSTQKA